MKKINLDHPWFEEFQGPHPLPMVQQSIDFIQAMRKELRAARAVVDLAKTHYKYCRDNDDYELEYALKKYDKTVEGAE